MRYVLVDQFTEQVSATVDSNLEPDQIQAVIDRVHQIEDYDNEILVEELQKADPSISIQWIDTEGEILYW
ncbi:MAG: hypothetical protein Q4C15_00650 [Eubacteriales bacterium]|nr:hypothetical protein [Eubacteriales bacterium]